MKRTWRLALATSLLLAALGSAACGGGGGSEVFSNRSDDSQAPAGPTQESMKAGARPGAHGTSDD